MSRERSIWRKIVETTRETQWLLPALGALAGVLLALAVGLVEASPDEVNWTFSIAEGRGALLSWLSILFAAFSIILALATLTIQNVISKFSLRMYRLYERDLRDRYVLALFAMTAAYIITEQILLRTASPDDTVPTTGFVVAFILLIATGVTLIWYITTVTRWFRVDRVARRVTQGALLAAEVSDALREGTDPVSGEAFIRADMGVSVTARDPGYLVEPDPRDLLAALGDASGSVVIDRIHGSPVVAGEVVGWVVTDGDQEEVADRIASAVDTEPDRGVVGSVAYGIVVLVDTAIMALSPAVNDPNTAVQVIEEMTFLFEGLAKHDLGSYEMSTGESTVTVRSRSFSDYLVLATEQIALYGKDDPFVMGALERMGASLAVLDLPPESAAAVEAFADRVRVAAQ